MSEFDVFRMVLGTAHHYNNSVIQCQLVVSISIIARGHYCAKTDWFKSHNKIVRHHTCIRAPRHVKHSRWTGNVINTLVFFFFNYFYSRNWCSWYRYVVIITYEWKYCYALYYVIIFANKQYHRVETWTMAN